MTELKKTVMGLFNTQDEANDALSELDRIGFDVGDISVIARDSSVRDIIDVTNVKEDDSLGENIIQGAAGGAATGGVIGGLTGLLAGLGAITVPGLGALFIGGPIAASLGLAGAAATTVAAATTGVLAGGLVGAFIGLGVPKETAELYQTRIKEGAVLLAVPVRTDSRLGEVEKVFSNYGAEEIYTIH